MGNSSANNKSTSSGTGGSLPAWATPGTSAYNTNNTALQTAPMGVATQTFNQGGIGNAGNTAINGLQGIAGQYQDMYKNAGQGGAAEQYLTSTAKGDYLNGSPYLEDIISKGASDTAGQVNNMFASGGRYGSVANQGALADSVTAQGNQLRNANYQTERDRQLAAGSALESAQQGRFGIQGNALSGAAGAQTGAAGLENQGFQNMLGMISQLPTIQGNKTYDAQQQQAVGGQIDSRTQEALNQAIQQWSQGDMEDWARLGGLITAGTGSAGSYGTQTGTQTSTQPGNALGVLGLIGSLFSDERLKEKIERIGSRNGFPLYAFNYKGKPERWIGVMAQDVLKIKPEAVDTDENGFHAVHYGKVGFPMERAA